MDVDRDAKLRLNGLSAQWSMASCPRLFNPRSPSFFGFASVRLRWAKQVPSSRKTMQSMPLLLLGLSPPMREHVLRNEQQHIAVARASRRRCGPLVGISHPTSVRRRLGPPVRRSVPDFLVLSLPAWKAPTHDTTSLWGRQRRVMIKLQYTAALLESRRALPTLLSHCVGQPIHP